MKNKHVLLLTVFLLVFCDVAIAARAMTLKFATVAPRGSMYHEVLQELGESWRRAEGADARFIIYTDGSQGTESDAVRRMRIGQLQGAMLTIAGLKDINESVGALQLMPLVFRSWDELDYVREGLAPELERGFAAKGFHVLFWGEGGWVQFFSRDPLTMPEDYKTAKIFTWTGTNAQVTIMKALDYQPIVLELGDIVPGVQTGMIDVVPVAPMWALAGQFYRNTPHMLKMNWVPIVGATLITTRAWDRMRPESREALTATAATVGQRLRANRTALDDRAIEAMVQRGLKVHEPTTATRDAWLEFIEPVWSMIRGTLVPQETFDKVQTLLAEYRGSRP